MARIDLTGLTFGRLTVIESDLTDKHGNSRWVVRCDCGKTYSTFGKDLRCGHTTRCRDCARVRHGNSAGGRTTSLYACWKNIRQRCYNAGHSDYANYGGRGIQMAPEWWNDFAAFAEYIWVMLGPRPEGHSLDRIDNDGSYEPGNLRWADGEQQGRNRRTNVTISLEGEQMLLKDFAELVGKDATGISRQLKKGVTAECIAERADYFDSLPLAA